MTVKRSIAKTYKKIKLKEQGSDFAEWKKLSAEQRLETVEQIRLDYHGWDYETQPGLQRILSIIKRK